MISLTRDGTICTNSPIGSQNVARLDQVENPYGPCPSALEALHRISATSALEISTRLKQGLQCTYGPNADSILLVDRIESAIQVLLEEFAGPVVTFPPAALSTWFEHEYGSRSHVRMVRSPGRRGMLDSEVAADLPWDSIALLESPSNPLGALLRPVDAVRLARACRLVVIDERLSEFGGHSLLGIAREFDNVVVLRSFEAWAGLPAYPCGWVLASPGVAAVLASRLNAPGTAAMTGALATLESADAMNVTLRLIREERSRLFRSLRKFAAFEPLPSWGPFVAARVGFGLRDEIVTALVAHKVIVHAPREDGLEDYIRFGLGTRSAMDQLHEALRQIMPALMDDALVGGRADANGLSLRGE
ncbi:MAG: aminotransferase class I/II-fold pyridoxal phosphate-dependent enzyme [Thermomicrobiales bacterium]